MAHLTLKSIEASFEKGWTCEDANGERYVYAETGRYKPFMPATIAAAKRHGYRVHKVGQSTFRVYAPAAQ